MRRLPIDASASSMLALRRLSIRTITVGSCAGLDVPTDELERRIVARTAAMFDHGVVAEVRAVLASGASQTAAQALGLDEIATMAESDAHDRIVIRTRRYAAYQRKWMRRIPDLVSVDGTLRPEEVADAILEVARSRQ